jgi:hypothetical protein
MGVSSAQAALTLSANPGGASLAGGNAVTFMNGIASFPDLALGNAGSGYVLQATPSGTSAAGTTSGTFNVSAIGTVITTAGNVIQDISVGDLCQPTCPPFSNAIYLTEVAPGPQPSSIGRIRRVSTTGGSVAAIADSVDYPQRILSIGSYEFYEAGDGASGLGRIERRAFFGGSPTVIAEGLTFLGGGTAPQFAYDSTDGIYFVSASGSSATIRRASANGGAIADIATTSVSAPCFALELDRSTSPYTPYLYYNGGNTIYRINGMGGSPQNLTTFHEFVGQCFSGASQLIVTAGRVYWFDNGGGSGSPAIRSVATTGGAIATHVSLSGCEAPSTAFTTDGLYLYMLQGSTFCPTGLVRYRLTDFLRTLISTDVNYDRPHLIGIDSNSIYWVNAAGTSILKAAR